MSPSLSVVSDNLDTLPRSEALSARVRRLQAEALSAEIAEGGEAYPAGIRDIARRLAEEVEAKVATIEAINSRQ